MENLLECRTTFAKASSFLLSNFKKEKGWLDFKTSSSGESTSWITAHVLWQAGSLLSLQKKSVAIKALKLQMHDEGGWGFSEQTPPDCDSTLHAVCALKSFGIADEALSNTLKFVLAHQSENGGFKTYKDEVLLLSYRKDKAPSNYIGWTSEHVCVTSVAFETFGLYPNLISKSALSKIVTFLLSKQNPDGYWNSYWWRSKYFATARILPTLSRINDKAAKRTTKLALDWIISSVHNDGFWDNGFDLEIPCPLSTANCVKALIALKHFPELVYKSVKWLISVQNPDGSWPSKPSLQIPNPGITNPEKVQSWRMGKRGVGSCCLDEKRIYTTATVAGAIDQFLSEMLIWK